MDDMMLAFYGNVDPRRKQELHDSRMVKEDHNAIANLSPQFIHREYKHDQFDEHLNMFNQSSKNWK